LLTPKTHSGVQPKHSQSGFANRNVLQTAHADGIIRIWDAGHGDEIQNRATLQVDIARAVGRSVDVAIAQMSMSGATGELAVGLQTGEVIVFRWGRNQYFGRDLPLEGAQAFGLEAVKDRAEPGLKEGLLPLSQLAEQHGRVTALKTSDIGFIAAGFEGGSIAVIDLRGPAVIYNEGLSGLTANQGKRPSFRKSNSQAPDAAEWPTCLEFGVMSLDGEGKPFNPVLCAGRIRCTIPWRFGIKAC
jgi:syntaxin-binding protein 5